MPEQDLINVVFERCGAKAGVRFISNYKTQAEIDAIRQKIEALGENSPSKIIATGLSMDDSIALCQAAITPTLISERLEDILEKKLPPTIEDFEITRLKMLAQKP
jgi:hypothetical protein